MKIRNKIYLLLAPALLAAHLLQAQGQRPAAPQPAYVEVAANPALRGSGIRHFFVGRNYRREWTMPVRVPVLDFRTEAGGLTPKKEGGGKETRSLQVEDSTGHVWSLRSVKKYPEKAVPVEFHHTIVENIVVDDISASYPYGALSMSVLSLAAQVPYLHNRLVYIPDDTALGKYRDKFKNSLVLMEDREPYNFLPARQHSGKEWKSISTEDLVYKLADKSKNRVDQLSLLRIRLLDNFVMDFDRHEGQWNWIGVDSGGIKTYYPIPKDRDQVFYTNQGLLPKIMRSKERLPELQGFKAKVEHMNTFNRTARNFDRTFLNGLTEEDWSHEVDRFLQAMTDSVIEAALALQPREIQGFAARKIVATLKEKRKYFRDDMMRYYRSLSETVSIVGTNESDLFAIDKNDSGLLLTVHPLDSTGQPGPATYSRLFNPGVTKELRLYALEGDDRFVATGPRLPIRVRMVGGPGTDSFINRGTAGSMLAYDVSFEQNMVDKGFVNRISANPMNNAYTRLDYNYKVVSLGPAGELSATEGIFLGLKFKIVTRGFRTDPYKMSHLFVLSHSLNSSSVHFRYDGDFMKLSQHTDLLVRADLLTPTIRTNFFGYGNDTPIDQKKFEHDYYHARYDIGTLSVLARTSLTHSFQISYGPSFQYLRLRNGENSAKYVNTYFAGAPPETYARKFYAGGELRVLVSTRNNAYLPTRGVVLTGYSRALAGLNGASHNTTQSGGSFSFYTDFGSAGTAVLATIFGGGYNTGAFELGQAQYLGFTDHLRGYRVQRFAGRSAAYNNTELRLKLANINAGLFPAALGIYGFNDVGRVWAASEKSSTWHDGYGAGIWLAPFNRLVVTGYLSFSPEEKALPWATIGFVF